MEFSTSNIMFILGVIGTIIGVYKSINNPQQELEKTQAINAERDKNKASVLNQKELEGKIQLIEKELDKKITLTENQFKWYMDSNNQKFSEMGERLDKAFLLASNHTKTIDTKVTKLADDIGIMKQSITALSTIINERIPKKEPC